MDLRFYKRKYRKILLGVYRDNSKYHIMSFWEAGPLIEQDLKARPASDLPQPSKTYAHAPRVQ